MHRKAFIVTFLLSVLAGCRTQTEIIENPLIEASLNPSVDVTRVEMRDSATVLTVTFSTHYPTTLSLENDMSIVTNGKEYRLTGFEGVDKEGKYRIPDSGIGNFGLVFEPIPVNTGAIDLNFRFNGRNATLFGIDLTGKNKYGFPEGLPASLKKIHRHRALPDPVLECGETGLMIHLLHYRPEIAGSMDVMVSSLFVNETFSLDIDKETATAECSFMLYGPAYIQIFLDGGSGYAWVAPGDKVDLYLDMRQSGSFSKTRVLKYYSDRMPQAERDAEIKRLSVRNIYATGRYGDYTNTVNSDFWCDPNNRYGLGLSSGDKRLYDMSADEYTDYVMSKYRALTDSIAGSGLSRMTREMLRINLSQETLDAIINGNRVRSMNYLDMNGLTILDVYRKKARLPQIDTMKAENYLAIKDIDNINSPEMLMGMNMDDYLGSIKYSYPSVVSIAELKDGFIPDLNSIGGMTYMAENAELDSADFRKLQEMDNPFYLEALKIMQEKAEDALAATAVIQETPEVEGNALFDAIVAPHKGKVILVDFWNTWCQPCRAAINAMEPLKESELADDDLVWIYIADVSSPEKQYRMMIPSIQGLHYYLNPEQRRSLSTQFGITQIPAYILVGRDGKYALREDFAHDRDLMVRTILQELGK